MTQVPLKCQESCADHVSARDCLPFPRQVIAFVDVDATATRILSSCHAYRPQESRYIETFISLWEDPFTLSTR